MYVLYCLVMWKNRTIEHWILARCLASSSAEKRALMTRDHQPATADDLEDGEDAVWDEKVITWRVGEGTWRPEECGWYLGEGDSMLPD